MTRQMIGDDPFPYGIKANQAMLDTITGYSHEQGLTPRQMKAEELFAERRSAYDRNRAGAQRGEQPMAELTLSFISNFNERVEPLMNGTVKADGIEIIPTYSHPSETFWRQLKFQEFQVAEMSMSSFLIARSRGVDMIALPVFPSRRFFHAEQSYHVDSGIKEPGDLNGKRIGVGEYQQTAALWARGVLEHDFGVSQYKVHWYMERTEELSHGGATGFTPPPGISFNRIPPDKSMATMLVNHEIDVAPIAGHLSRAVNVIDRSTHLRGSEGDWSKVKPLFPDEIAEAKRFFAEHGFVPVNHTYIIRGDVYREQPGIAMKLYEAFIAAKAHSRRQPFWSASRQRSCLARSISR